uniref:Uncharacterized protein n=1 Tax=Meloidogyne incognita TaxID=6306 RepID=A0A914M820_MELIC
MILDTSYHSILHLYNHHHHQQKQRPTTAAISRYLAVAIDRLKSSVKERKKKQLDSETVEQKGIRLEKQRERNRKRIANESEIERENRLSTKREKSRIRFENETEVEREIRLEKNRKRFASESEVERENRLKNKRNRINNETEIERENRLAYFKANKIRNRLSAVQLYAAGDSSNVNSHRLGRMDVECTYCGALHFPEEKISNKGSMFKDCCHYGKVHLTMLPEDEFPDLLKNLFMRLDARHKNFFDCIRNLNSSVSMASMNPLRYRYPSNRGPYCFRICGQIYHRMNLALNPDPEDEPAYGQVFIVDTVKLLVHCIDLTQS